MSDSVIEAFSSVGAKLHSVVPTSQSRSVCSCFIANKEPFNILQGDSLFAAFFHRCFRMQCCSGLMRVAGRSLWHFKELKRTSPIHAHARTRTYSNTFSGSPMLVVPRQISLLAASMENLLHVRM